jgi:hypothetical protein
MFRQSSIFWIIANCSRFQAALQMPLSAWRSQSPFKNPSGFYNLTGLNMIYH